MDNQFGFTTNSIDIIDLNKLLAIQVFVEKYYCNDFSFMVCGNIEIVEERLPYYGIGLLIVKIKDITLSDTHASIRYTSLNRVSEISICFKDKLDKKPYSLLDNYLKIQKEWYQANPVQVLIDNNVTKPSYSDEVNICYLIPDDSVFVKINSRYYNKLIRIKDDNDKVHTNSICYDYTISCLYDKTTLHLNTSNILNKEILIEGDFNYYIQNVGDNIRVITVNNHSYYKNYKTFSFSINGDIQNYTFVKSSSYPDTINFIANQNKIKFNLPFQIPAIVTINNIYKYDIKIGDFEIQLDKGIKLQTISVVELISNKVILEKEFVSATTYADTNMPALWIDTESREIRISSISKKTVEVKLKGFNVIHIKPGEISHPLPYQIYSKINKADIICITIEAYLNCSIEKNKFFMLI